MNEYQKHEHEQQWTWTKINRKINIYINTKRQTWTKKLTETYGETTQKFKRNLMEKKLENQPKRERLRGRGAIWGEKWEIEMLGVWGVIWSEWRNALRSLFTWDLTRRGEEAVWDLRYEWRNTLRGEEVDRWKWRGCCAESEGRMGLGRWMWRTF